MNEKIHIKDIIKPLAKEEGIVIKKAEDLVLGVFNDMVNLLKQEKSISIPGFGIFTLINTAARNGINPATGKKMKIKAGKKVKFKPSSTLKADIKES